MKVSRRNLARSIAAAAATASLPMQAAAQAPAQTPADPELQAARASLRSAVEAVRRVELPMSTEPVTKFETKG